MSHPALQSVAVVPIVRFVVGRIRMAFSLSCSWRCAAVLARACVLC